MIIINIVVTAIVIVIIIIIIIIIITGRKELVRYFNKYITLKKVQFAPQYSSNSTGTQQQDR